MVQFVCVQNVLKCKYVATLTTVQYWIMSIPVNFHVTFPGKLFATFLTLETSFSFVNFLDMGGSGFV